MDSERPDAATVALMALSWVLSDDDRAQRLLSLTGMDPDHLRFALSDPSVLGSVLDFLANHEGDLMAASEALSLSPESIIAARNVLAPPDYEM
ncbi:DUF3572 domain-containing protein [Croceicoccus mobilis]|uniref:DUF3572 domain-containing protein n=1 Tax=Croceicoccus mobilis TaxID=1703339 RepID=A0A916YRR7_9SPHN|nr:DUF3572 domain-containing protein [Croceicoccus mobilis]GGD57891.1 hypothetical protein GCM10010990_03970 [Croceicoccus mobilis]